jgi:Holliday junction resolvase RusA-like endonuclease
MSDLIVTVPLPPSLLQPNRKSHWAKKSRAVRDYRWAAKMACLAALREAKEIIAWDAAEVEPHFYFRVKRRRDPDNLAASLKAARDGLADAGLVKNDCNIRNAEPVVHIDKDNPRVELWIRKLKLLVAIG